MSDRRDQAAAAPGGGANRDPAPIPILLYHAVTEDPPPWIAHWSVTPRTFAAHLDAAIDAGCTLLSVVDLIDGLDAATLPERPLVITFDDGYADFLTGALPALSARAGRATIYVTTGGLVGAPHPVPPCTPPAAMLAWSDLAELESAGIEVGPHTQSHPQLDTLSARRAEEEVATSTRLLADALGKAPRTFAYPHGYSNRRVRAFVRQLGFDAACGVREALSYAGDDRYNLARLTVHDDTTAEVVASWAVGQGAPLAPGREPLRTTAWRWYRRGRRVLVAAADERRSP